LIFLQQHYNTIAKQNMLQKRLFLFLFPSATLSFAPSFHSYNINTKLQSALYEDFEEFESSSINSNNNRGNNNFDNDSTTSSSSDDFYASLRARQGSVNSSIGEGTSKSSLPFHMKLTEEELQTRSNWKSAQCSPTIRLHLDDWIRRLALDTFPLAVCGSSGGNIYLADLDKGEELDCITSVHEAHIEDEQVNEAMSKLFGKYDGGGVIAVAICGDIVVSSGREGGVHVFHIDGEEQNYYKGSRGGSATTTVVSLRSEGKIRPLDSTLVTSLAFDKDGLLWTAGYDGFVRAFEYDNKDIPLVLQREPFYEFDLGAEVLSVTVNDEIGCGVATTTSGTVFLFSLDEGEVIGEWTPFGKGVGKRKREYARSAVIHKNDDQSDTQDAVWSVFCGGSEGSLYQRKLNVDRVGFIDERKPFAKDEALRGRLRPSHSDAILDLASPGTGIILSGSQDGTIRVWDTSYYKNEQLDTGIIISIDDGNEEDDAEYNDVGGVDRRPKCMYALSGYKVWLGSVVTDGKRLISDGADNTIIVHNFSDEDDATEGYFLEDDDMEDFSFD
jgi:WD40 repeat protein